MRTDQIALRARYSAHIGDGNAFTDYPDSWMFNECTDKLHTVFEDIVTKARQGYWLKETFLTTSSTKSRYRIPHRSAAGGLEKVEIAQTAIGPWTKLEEIPSAATSRYEGMSTTKGFSRLYTVQGDQVELMPAPDQAYVLRLTYYLRPSQLVAQQSSTDNGGVIRGLIVATSNSPPSVQVNVIPFDQSLAVPVAITSANQKIDIIHPNGWHELSLVGATQTITGPTFFITDGQSIDDVEIGDYVRVSEQTDWPCLPDDYHRCLADMAAVKIMDELKSDSSGIAAGVQADMVKFRSMLTPRVKADPQTVPVCLGGWTFGGPYG